MTQRDDSAPQVPTESDSQSGAGLNLEARRAQVELPRLFTIKEAAHALRIHRNTVTREVANGRLGCVRLGRRVLVRADQLRRYIDDRTAKGEECNGFLSMGIIGYTADGTPRTGTSIGADRERDASAAAQRALQTLKRPSGS